MTTNTINFQGLVIPIKDMTKAKIHKNIKGLANIIFDWNGIQVSVVAFINASGNQTGWSVYIGDNHLHFGNAAAFNNFFDPHWGHVAWVDTEEE